MTETKNRPSNGSYLTSTLKQKQRQQFNVINQHRDKGDQIRERELHSATFWGRDSEAPLYGIDGLVQDCTNSIANALELLQPCTKPSI